MSNIHFELTNVSAWTTTNLDWSEVGANNTVSCAEGFYVDNSSSSTPVCEPLCVYWLSTSRSLAIIVTEVIGRAVTIVSSLIIFVLAFWPQRDTL